MRFDAEVVADNAPCMWDSLARSGQARAHEVGDVFDGLAGFRKSSNLKHMDHTRPDFATAARQNKRSALPSDFTDMMQKRYFARSHLFT